MQTQIQMSSFIRCLATFVVGGLLVLLQPHWGDQALLDRSWRCLSPHQVSWYCILGCKAEGSYGKVRLNNNHLPNSGEAVRQVLLQETSPKPPSWQPSVCSPLWSHYHSGLTLIPTRVTTKIQQWRRSFIQLLFNSCTALILWVKAEMFSVHRSQLTAGAPLKSKV